MGEKGRGYNIPKMEPIYDGDEYPKEATLEEGESREFGFKYFLWILADSKEEADEKLNEVLRKLFNQKII